MRPRRKAIHVNNETPEQLELKFVRYQTLIRVGVSVSISLVEPPCDAP